MDNTQSSDDQVVRIGLDMIDEPPHAMRTEMDEDALRELADDIRRNGLISPITVRPFGGRYQVVAGHRRLLACARARLFVIPCVVRDLTDAQVFDIMTSENLKRHDVDPVDEGIHFARAMQEHSFTVAQLAEHVGRGTQYVEDRIVIASLPEYMRSHIRAGRLKLGVALALAQIHPEEKRQFWCGLAIQDNVTVRTAEYWAYQDKLGTLPDVVPDGEAAPDAPGGSRHIIKFRCSVDGKEYPAAATTMVTIALENLEVFDAFVAEYRKQLVVAEFAPVGGEITE